MEIAKEQPASLITMSSMTTGPAPLGRPARIFISYAHADEAHRKRLEVHLSPLIREGLIEAWHDRMIPAGSAWSKEIDRNLTEADIVVLLTSADFVASDYCFEIELQLALNRQSFGEVQVIPVFVEPADFSRMPFAKFQGLPRDAKPVSLWPNRDEAWRDVARGIRTVVEGLGQPRIPSPSPKGGMLWRIRQTAAVTKLKVFALADDGNAEQAFLDEIHRNQNDYFATWAADNRTWRIHHLHCSSLVFDPKKKFKLTASPKVVASTEAELIEWAARFGAATSRCTRCPDPK